MEFSGELSDFIMKDVREQYAHVKDDIKVTLIEVLRTLLDFKYEEMNHHVITYEVNQCFYWTGK